MMETMLYATAALAVLPSLVSAQHVHGGDANGAGGVMMIPYLHFTPGDALFFQDWVPRSSGAIGGACVGLFVLAILQRCLSAMKGVMEQHWRHRSNALVAARFVRLRDSRSSSDKASEEGGCCAPEAGTAQAPASRPTLPPFVTSHELARGAMQIIQSFFGYALMLAVMTFNAAFIISVLLGLGVGEVLFGRFVHGLVHSE
ncbi:copper transport protein CTR2 [Ceratobasidium sp. AG-Ba]|nr:copper transport protein CTR2 [Ceratobasidium sp. AG-Ba]